MKRVWFLFLLIPSIAFGAAWEETQPAGSSSPSDIDTLQATNNDALVRLLKDELPILSYASSSTITISNGSVMVANSTGSDAEMLYNSSATTGSTASLDTGSTFTSSTTYHVYLYGSSSADTFSVAISTNASTPSGITQYKRIGSFYVNSSGAITLINNDNLTGEMASLSSKSIGTTYQATTDGEVVAYAYFNHGTSNYGYNRIYGYVGDSSAATIVASGVCNHIVNTDAPQATSISFMVRAGEYYKVERSTPTGSAPDNSGMYFRETQ